MKKKFHWLVLWLLGSFLVGGCTPSPAPIRYGQDNCAHCQMLVMDAHFGTELVTDKGKIYVFDSIECLAWHSTASRMPPGQVHSRWVTPVDAPGTLVDAAGAFYLASDNLRSPMGLNLSAFRDENTARSFQQNYGGEVLRWDGVTALVGRRWGQSQ